VLRINALGSFAVIGDDGPLAGAVTQPRRTAILALIARAADRGIAREKILNYLWPDSDEEHGRRVLTKALSALRADLGAEDVFLGLSDLRLNPAVVTCDVIEFEAAVAEADLDRAATLYRGPFLDGFRLPGANEFERWVEAERAALAHEYEVTIERLAKLADTRGDHANAVRWWRRLAAQDPLHARYAVGLMQALAAAGDRGGALQHARVYEALVEQELDLPPDGEVVALAHRLRSETRAAIVPAPAASAIGVAPERSAVAFLSPASTSSPPAVAPESLSPIPALSAPHAASPEPVTATEIGMAHHVQPTPEQRWLTRPRTLVAVGVVALVAVGIALRQSARGSAPPVESPVVALGRITEYRTGSAQGIALPLADMLATNLARATGLRVISNARMYELLAQLGADRDSAAASVMVAARRAGATEVVDGALFELADGQLRLDLRRIDLASGAVKGALSVTGAEPFALADSGTARLLEAFGATGPGSSIADVTTRSLAAYRFYEEGLRAFYHNEWEVADRLFGAALAEDSTFAMAAYYHALTPATSDLASNTMQVRFRRAIRLADRASERERLIIRAAWAATVSSPEQVILAESLVTRYPDEVAGHLMLGRALVNDGDYVAALKHLRRAVEVDAPSLAGNGAQCLACGATLELVHAYVTMDSLPAAEREARRWTEQAPQSATAWLELASVLAEQGREREALDALQASARLGKGSPDDIGGALPALLIMLGQYERADSVLRAHLATGSPDERASAYWFLAISLRNQGRLDDALGAARRIRAADTSKVAANAVPYVALGEAQVLFEMGRYRQAAALFDSISRAPDPFDAPSHTARRGAWALTHMAAALAGAGDTAGLPRLADTIRVLGKASGFGRYRHLHHHVQGLLLAARGLDDEAIAAFRRAIVSPTSGYTRTNYEVARLELRRGRARAAVVMLQPTLRGSVEAANLYLMRTEVHELLAQAWELAGGPPARDSAAAHWGAVTRAWRRADPQFASRVRTAESRLAALVRQR
jgi:DNA-binding SARP family transcriptional activator